MNMKKSALFFVALVFIMNSYAQPLPNPLALWTFNDSTAEDYSGFNYDGDTNAIEFVTGIDCTPGAYFNGSNSSIDFGDILDDVFTSNVFSISLWVKPESYVDEDGYPCMIIDKWHSSGGPTDNAFIVYYDVYCTNNKSMNFPRLSLKEWQHIVVSNDTGKVAIYVNNIKVAEDEGFVSNETDYSLLLGVHYSGHYNFDGVMDDIRIYREALTEEQVGQIYSASPYSELLMEDQTAFINKEVTIGVDDIFQSYSWSNGANTPTITVVENESATKGYRLTVTDDEDCTMSDSITVRWFEPEDSLSAFWNFNDGSADDLSGNGIDGTINEAVPVDTGVKCSNSLSFDGHNSNIDFGDALGDVFTSGDFTISLWASIKDTIDDEGFDGMLIEKWYTSGQPNNTFILYTNRFRSNSKSATFFTPVLDKWNHYVVVNKLNHVIVYINNVPVGTSFSNQFNATTYPLMIAGFHNDRYNFEGYIDEVRIYDRALGTNEISDLYQNGLIQPLNRLSDMIVDAGEDVILDAGSGNDDYLWSTEETTQIIQILDVTENIPMVWVIAKDEEGCYSDTISISIGTNAISDIDVNNAVVFPNPASSILYIEFNAPVNNVKIEIYDITGKHCINREYYSTKEIKLDISSYQEGTYLLKMNINGNRGEFKFVINR
jgi:hypothetical protein